MRINLTTPMSGDKERERHTKAVIDAIERYTEERMNDEYGRIHTDGSRSGGQPLYSDVEQVARALAQADGIEICSDATYALSSYGHKAQAALAAMRQPTQSKVAAACTDRIGGAGVLMHSVVVDAQSDALRDQLLQECLVKLRDVQGTEAPKQYACNLIKRIERVLQEQSE